MVPSVLPAAGVKRGAHVLTTDNGVNDIEDDVGAHREEAEGLENGHMLEDDEDREEEEEGDEGEEGEAEGEEDEGEGEGTQDTVMEEEIEPARAVANGAASLTGAAIDYGGDYSLDEGNLLVCDTRPLDGAGLFDHTPESEKLLLSLAQVAVQQLTDRLFSLPATPHKMGRLVDLPTPSTALPREKPVPRGKAMTKWEKFAQTKGIQKTKRSKFVFEETSGDWKRRYGYQRANDPKAVPIVEASSKDEPGSDGFSRLEKDKKERVKRNEKSHRGNLKTSRKQDIASSALQRQLAATSASVGRQGSLPGAAKVKKGDVAGVAALAVGATASAGKFDKRLDGEKAPKKLGKHRKFNPVVDKLRGEGKEAKMIKGVIDKVLTKSGGGGEMNMNKAVKAVRIEEESRNRERKKAGLGKKRQKGTTDRDGKKVKR